MVKMFDLGTRRDDHLTRWFYIVYCKKTTKKDQLHQTRMVPYNNINMTKKDFSVFAWQNKMLSCLDNNIDFFVCFQLLFG